MRNLLIIALFSLGIAEARDTVQVKPDWRALVASDIKEFEGWRSMPYRDQFGILTIGWGRNLNNGISKEEGERMFENDLKTAIHICGKLVDDFAEHPASVKRGLVNMAFELGENKFGDFKDMIEALRNKDYIRAAEEVLRSDFAGEVEHRAQYIAHLIAQAGDDVISKARMEALKLERKAKKDGG